MFFFRINCCSDNLFEYFHRNPELSSLETKTAARLAQELRDAGFDVTVVAPRDSLQVIAK